jgi:hypothetical protein
LVPDIIQLFPPLPYAITNLGCPDDIQRRTEFVTCYCVGIIERIGWYILRYNTDLDRLKNADFERAMKLITTRIDVKNDDKLMHLVFKESVANGALELNF